MAEIALDVVGGFPGEDHPDPRGVVVDVTVADGTQRSAQVYVLRTGG